MRHHQRLLCALLVLAATRAEAAVDNDTTWEFRQDATAGMLNGGGFDRTATFTLNDLVTTTGTSATPTVSSTALYAFTDADENHWLYIASGTQWIPGFYKITAVDAGVATLDAAIGKANIIDANGNWGTNTSAGCATADDPSGDGTFGIDYSRGTAAIDSGTTDLTCADGDANPGVLTSSSHNFLPQDIGNIIHITAGTEFTAGWYEIVSVNTNAATLDRACGTTDGEKTGGTWYLGGALDLTGTLGDAFFDVFPANNVAWIRYSATAYTLGAIINSAANTLADGTAANPVSRIVGYNTIRGDTPTGTDRPIIDSAYSITLGQYMNLANLRFTQSGAGLIMGTSGSAENIRFTNTSTSTTRVAYTAGALGTSRDIEAVCQHCTAIVSGTGRSVGLYAHDSLHGINIPATGGSVVHSIAAHNRTTGIQAAGGSGIISSTVYGRANPHSGQLGIDFAGTTRNGVIDTIVADVATCMTATSAITSNYVDYNNLHNCTTATLTNVKPGRHDLAVDPQFVDASEYDVAGCSASQNSYTLTCTGYNFNTAGVENNVDYFHLTTAGVNGLVGGYLVTNHTEDTLTLNGYVATAGAGSGMGGYVSTGHNFAIGTNLKAAGFPGAVQGAATTSYLDTGAVQRPETTPTPQPCVNDESCPAGYVCRTPTPG